MKAMKDDDWQTWVVRLIGWVLCSLSGVLIGTGNNLHLTIPFALLALFGWPFLTIAVRHRPSKRQP